MLVNSRIEYKCGMRRFECPPSSSKTPPARILNIDRALRAVGHALLGLSAPALVMFVRFDVGFKSAPTAVLSLIILVLPARGGGFIRAATALVTTGPVSR